MRRSARAVRAGARRARSFPRARPGRWFVVPNCASPPRAWPPRRLPRIYGLLILGQQRLQPVAIAIQALQIGADIGIAVDRLIQIARPLHVSARQRQILSRIRPRQRGLLRLPQFAFRAEQISVALLFEFSRAWLETQALG